MKFKELKKTLLESLVNPNSKDLGALRFTLETNNAHYWLIKADELIREACAYMGDVNAGKITRTEENDKRFQDNLCTAVTLVSFVRTTSFRSDNDTEGHKINKKA